MNKRQKKKQLKRELGRMRTSVDYSNGKDMTVECRYRIKNSTIDVVAYKYY